MTPPTTTTTTPTVRLDAHGRRNRRIRPGTIAGRGFLALLLATWLVLAPGSPRAHAADMFGYDMSWPQCPAAQGGGQPMPPTSTEFVIVGLTRGLAFSENPCLASMVSWVKTNNKPAHAYTMATFPNATQLATHRAAGPYNAATRAGQLANVGYAEAQYALASLARVGWQPPVVWIDVEPRPASPWPGSTSAQKLDNRYVIQGLVRALRDAGVGYGFYSYANGWNEIVGAWSVPGVPVWATAGTLNYPTEALDRCTQPSFSGGKVYLAQWTDGRYDYNRTCGSYAFTDLPRNLAGTATVSASSIDTAVSPTPARVSDGVAQGYPVDTSMEWSSDQQKAGAWVELRWPSPVTLDRAVLHDRPNLDDQTLGGTLRFSDGSTVAVGALPNDGAALNVSFSARAVTSVRFTVGSAGATTWAAGLSEFEAWGKPGGPTAPPPSPTPPPPSTDANLARAAGVGVTASSQDAAAGQPATAAVDGSTLGYPVDDTKEWATIGGGAGSWLQLAWPEPVRLNRVVLHDRPNSNDHATAASLTFSDGSTLAVPALHNDGSATTLTFPARTTASLRVTLTTVSGATENIGLAELEAWGVKATLSNVARAGGVSATASSQDVGSGQSAAKAIDGSTSGYPADSSREWATVGGGAGSWLHLRWGAPVTVNRVVLHDRPNPNDHVTGATLTFADGSTVAVPALANSGAATTVTFPARTTTTLRLTVTSASGATENVGLAEIEAWGSA